MDISSTLCSVVSSVCSAVSRLCTGKGGAIMRSISELAPVIIQVVKAVCTVISVLAEIYTEKPKEEKSEEIGMKAELAEKRPEDFDSINNYLKYLRQEIEPVSGKLDNLSEEEKQKYQLVGLGLYIKNIEEQQGMLLPPDFIRVVPKLKEQGYEAADIANLMQSMKNNGVTDMKQYVDFMKGDLQPGSFERQQVYLSVKDMVEQCVKGEEVNIRQEINNLADAVRE